MLRLTSLPGDPFVISSFFKRMCKAFAIGIFLTQLLLLPTNARAQITYFGAVLVVITLDGLKVAKDGKDVWEFGREVVYDATYNNNYGDFTGGATLPGQRFTNHQAVINSKSLLEFELAFQWRMLVFLKQSRGYTEEDRQFFLLTQKLETQTQSFDELWRRDRFRPFNLLSATRRQEWSDVYSSVFQQRNEFLQMRHREARQERRLTPSCRNFVQKDSGYEPPAGWGLAYDVFTGAQIFGVECGGTRERPITEVHVPSRSDQQFTYRVGWFFSENGWVRINFEPLTGRMSGNWVVGKAVASLKPELLREGDQYVAAYVCNFVNNTWRCGCRDQRCVDSANWQLQVFAVDGLFD